MISPPQGRGQESVVVGLLGVAMAVSILSGFSVGVLAVPIIADLHLTRAELGLAAAVNSGFGALSSVVLGGVADRRGGGALLAVGFAFGIVALLLVAASGSFAVLLIGSAAGGLCLGAAMPSTNRIILDSLGRRIRGSATGIKQAAEMVGIVLVGLFMPTLAAILDWRAAIALLAVVPAAAFVVTLSLLRAAPAPDRSHDAPPTTYRSSLDLWWATAYAAAMGVSGGAISPYLPLYAQEALGLSPAAAGLIFSVVGMVAIPGRILWGRYAERTGTFQSGLIMLAVIALGSAFAIWAASSVGPGLLFVGAIGWGASQLSFMVVAMLAVMAFATHETAGTASGVVLLGFGAGFMVGPIVFGNLADLTGGYDAGFVAVVSVLTAATAIAWAWRRHSALTAPIQAG